MKIPFPAHKNPKFTFIDLFAWIGGFHLALHNLWWKCVFSSEIDENARKTYEANYGEIPSWDITKQEVKDKIPENFDVLCAGFPCQPFSKWGFQNGFDDTRGTLFFDICEILSKHKPKFVLLENVANLVSHDNWNTFFVIQKHLTELGYIFPKNPLILSPHQFSIPALRPRLYIPCIHTNIAWKNKDFIINFQKHIEKLFQKNIQPIETILDISKKYENEKISEYEEKVLKVWDEFYQWIDLKIIGFPVWVDYFYEKDIEEWMPIWKQKIIQKNKELYKRNKNFIDSWLKKYDFLKDLNSTHKKFEWQAGTYHSSIFEALIQFRPSGVRVKKADKFSTLVAMNHRQIIGKLKRKISVDESKLLQSFPKNFLMHPVESTALKQLWNSVNINVVENIFSLIYSNYEANWANS